MKITKRFLQKHNWDELQQIKNWCNEILIDRGFTGHSEPDISNPDGC